MFGHFLKKMKNEKNENIICLYKIAAPGKNRVSKTFKKKNKF